MCCTRPSRVSSRTTVDPQRPMRQPISIMQIRDRVAGSDFLYKAVGDGTPAWQRARPARAISLLGPIGVPFEVTEKRRC